MQNVELKARLNDRAAAEVACRALGATLEGDLQQTDTYFRVAHGRLKLRELEPGQDYLVFYQRADEAEARTCDYVIANAGPGMRPLLSQALDVIAVVEKVRTLYLWHNVRIHLDRVAALGEFIEFEAVLDDAHDAADGHAKLTQLCDAFGINPADIESQSYLEMVSVKAGNE